MNTPLLSVCIITYNHENFIRQAIEGVLMQKVDFEYEIIIADDYSTDNTRAIIMEYKEKNPCLFKLIFQEKNVGAAQNWFDLITTPKSKYIAYFEGDDYWIDSLKLQKQVDFLENNQDYTLCHSDVYTLMPNCEIIEKHKFKSWNYVNDIFDYKLSIFNPLAFTCTCVFRNIIPCKKLSKKIVSGDWMLFILLTLEGKAKFFKEKQAVYRLNTGVSVYTIWHKNFHQQSLFLLNQINIKKPIEKNIWLFRGALYFILIKFSEVFKFQLLKRIGDKLKYKAQ